MRGVSPTLSPQDSLEDFVRDLIHAAHEDHIMSLPVVPDEGAPGSGFGFVSLRTEDQIAWRIDGLVYVSKAAALWRSLVHAGHSG
jgi:hypothetical protein